MLRITDKTNCSCPGKCSSKYENDNGKMWNESGEGSLTKSNFLLIPGSVSWLAGAKVIQFAHVRNWSLVLSAREPTKAFNGN